MASPSTRRESYKCVYPPTLICFPIPTPPETTSAPESGRIEGRGSFNFNWPANPVEPDTFRSPPTLIFFPIPTPPATTNAPLEESVELKFALSIKRRLLKVTLESTLNVPVITVDD